MRGLVDTDSPLKIPQTPHLVSIVYSAEPIEPAMAVWNTPHPQCPMSSRLKGSVAGQRFAFLKGQLSGSRLSRLFFVLQTDPLTNPTFRSTNYVDATYALPE